MQINGKKEERLERRGQFFLPRASALAASPLSSLAYSQSTVTQKKHKRLPVVFQAGSWKKSWKEACWYVMKTLGTYHLTENFGNSGWKINGRVTYRKSMSTFWGSPFISACTNQTECCLPFTNFSVPSRSSRLTLHKFANLQWQFCGKLVNHLPLCFRHPNRIFLPNGKHHLFQLNRLFESLRSKVAFGPWPVFHIRFDLFGLPCV